MTETIDTAKPPRGKDVVQKREGINAWGLYVEILHYYEATGKLALQRRVLVAENSVSESVRRAGMKQARWVCKNFPDHDEAMRDFMDRIDKAFKGGPAPTKAEMRGEPVLLQLTEVDVEQLRRGEAPFGRYSALHHVDKRLGKLDEETYRGGNVVPTGTPTGTPGPTGASVTL